MKRLLFAAVCALMLTAGSASANGWFGKGYINAGPAVTAKWGPGGQQNGAQPGVLGPWYLYWPYEAHFVTPAHPQFTGASSMTLPGGQGAVEHPNYPCPQGWR